MAVETLSESQAAEILESEVGSGWDISAPLGTMQATRIATRGTRSVVIKLIRTSASVMRRLSELGVTPPVIALGESGGIVHMVQEAVDGPHPDHAWFRDNRRRWVQMIDRYLADDELASVLAARPAFWRLDVAAAVQLIDRDLQRAPGRSPALHGSAFRSALDRWRARAASLPSLPMRPIHPDAHWHNYLISQGEPLLLDWDYVDLSDPMRDVGSQLWGFLPREYWPEALQQLGLPVEDESDAAICWWAGFKLLGNALFNDSKDNPDGTASHVEMFLLAAADRPWLPSLR